MNEKIQKLKGANMDIDLASPQGVSLGSRIAVRGIKPRAQVPPSVW